jgi:HK97 family phage major capsid protein
MAPGQDAAASGQVSGAADSVWGKPVYVTSALGAGTALIGTVAGAQVWNRGGPSVEATKSHGTLFQTDMTAIRCERRLGLTVYRPQAYTEVRVA